jgi:hypothetical protein
MATVRKNGKAYDSGDVVITLEGTPYDGFKEISYSSKQEHQLNYTLGNNEASSWSEGKVEHSASVTMYMELIHQLSLVYGKNPLKWPPLTFNVTFVNDYNDIINDTVLAKVQSMGREVTGEMGLATQFELFALGNDYDNF